MNPLVADLIRYALWGAIAIGALGVVYIIAILGVAFSMPGAILGGKK